MSFPTFLLVLASVSCNALAQVLLKTAVTRAGTLAPLDLGARLGIDIAFWAGVAAFGTSFLLWLLVLARLPVSIAYPLASIGYVVAAAFGFLLLEEPITLTRVAGILVICLGVALLTADWPPPLR